MNQCEHCGAYLDPGEKCDCQSGLAIHCVQAPIISENLDSIRQQLSAMVNQACSLERSDENLKRIKSLRSDLSKQFAQMEEQRKEVKRQVMQPYTRAEEKYKACIADPYHQADQQLKAWVDDYQNELKNAAWQKLEAYRAELCQAHNVPPFTLEQAGVSVDMAAARQEMPKKAMQQLEAFALRIQQEVSTISTLEDSEAVMAEYVRDFDLSRAIQAVSFRRQKEEAAKEAIRRAEESKNQRSALLEAAPELKQEEDVYTMAFTVTGTLPELKALKAYILSRNLTLEEDN